MLFYEDLKIGFEIITPPYLITKMEAIEFARKYDPQYFHVDEDLATKSIYGKLIVSGWLTVAVTMKLIAENVFNNITVQGSPGVDELKWKKAVFPMDRLFVKASIFGKRESKSRKNLGIVLWDWKTINQYQDEVLSLKVAVFVEKKKGGAL